MGVGGFTWGCVVMAVSSWAEKMHNVFSRVCVGVLKWFRWTVVENQILAPGLTLWGPKSCKITTESGEITKIELFMSGMSALSVAVPRVYCCGISQQRQVVSSLSANWFCFDLPLKIALSDLFFILFIYFFLKEAVWGAMLGSVG